MLFLILVKKYRKFDELDSQDNDPVDEEIVKPICKYIKLGILSEPDYMQLDVKQKNKIKYLEIE